MRSNFPKLKVGMIVVTAEENNNHYLVTKDKLIAYDGYLSRSSYNLEGVFKFPSQQKFNIVKVYSKDTATRLNLESAVYGEEPIWSLN